MDAHPVLRALAAALVAAACAGCSVRQLAVDSLGDALASAGGAYAADDDLELIAVATPFGLKTVEVLLAESPSHPGLLLAAARGFTQYAYAFVEAPADELDDRDVATAYAQRARALKLYLRARGYALRGLEVRHPGLRAALDRDPAAALAACGPDDVALLYWGAASWASAISLGKDSPALVAELPAAGALIERAAALDESFDDGAIHVFLIAYEMARPDGARDRVARARHHFDRSVSLTGGRQAAPFVTYAEAVSIARGDRAEFDALLARAAALDPSAAPQWTLANRVFQRRAVWLRARADRYFSN
jgi:predicted anti-sigma-YlaC factor YlaD